MAGGTAPWGTLGQPRVAPGYLAGSHPRGCPCRCGRSQRPCTSAPGALPVCLAPPRTGRWPCPGSLQGHGDPVSPAALGGCWLAHPGSGCPHYLQAQQRTPSHSRCRSTSPLAGRRRHPDTGSRACAGGPSSAPSTSRGALWEEGGRARGPWRPSPCSGQHPGCQRPAPAGRVQLMAQSGKQHFCQGWSLAWAQESSSAHSSGVRCGLTFGHPPGLSVRGGKGRQGQGQEQGQAPLTLWAPTFPEPWDTLAAAGGLSSCPVAALPRKGFSSDPGGVGHHRPSDCLLTSFGGQARAAASAAAALLVPRALLIPSTGGAAWHRGGRRLLGQGADARFLWGAGGGGAGGGGVTAGVPHPDLQPPGRGGGTPARCFPALPGTGLSGSHLGTGAGRRSRSCAGSTSPRWGTRCRAGTRLCSRNWEQPGVG